MYFVCPGFPISGFQVDAVDQVVLNLQDQVHQTWKPGDHIVIASTDYSMHQAEEFTLLPCPQCTSRQVRIQGERTEVCVFVCVGVSLYLILDRSKALLKVLA